MTPHQIEVIQLNHQIEKVEGKSHRVAEEVIDLLQVALKASQRGRTEVVQERLDVSIRLLQELLNNQ